MKASVVSALLGLAAAAPPLIFFSCAVVSHETHAARGLVAHQLPMLLLLLSTITPVAHAAPVVYKVAAYAEFTYAKNLTLTNMELLMNTQKLTSMLLRRLMLTVLSLDLTMLHFPTVATSMLSTPLTTTRDMLLIPPCWKYIQHCLPTNYGSCFRISFCSISMYWILASTTSPGHSPFWHRQPHHSPALQRQCSLRGPARSGSCLFLPVSSNLFFSVTSNLIPLS